MKYPRNVTNRFATELMMKLEGFEEIVNGDAWFGLDIYDTPILAGFIQPTEKDDQRDILYRFERIRDGNGRLGWVKKKESEVIIKVSLLQKEFLNR